MVVVDDNIVMDCFKRDDVGVSQNLGRLLDWLMREYNKIIDIQRDYLPLKAKRAVYPHFIWIEAPMHKNFANNPDRFRFNRALNTVSKLHDNMSILGLKKIWDAKDGNLFLENERRFTTSGLHHYWEVVDKTVRYADTILLKKQGKLKQQKAAIPTFAGNAGGKTTLKDKYHWRTPSYTKDRKRPLRSPSPESWCRHSRGCFDRDLSHLNNEY